MPRVDHGVRNAHERSKASADIKILRVHLSNQDSIDLLVRADHVESAADIDKHCFFVESNGAGIPLPDAEPNVATLKLGCRLMDCLHES